MPFGIYTAECSTDEDRWTVQFVVEFPDDQTLEDFDDYQLKDELKAMEMPDKWTLMGEAPLLDEVVLMAPEAPHFRVSKDGKITQLRRSLQVQPMDDD